MGPKQPDSRGGSCFSRFHYTRVNLASTCAGMNGVILRARDLGSLMAHFRAGIARKPPDILWQEWAAGDHKPKACLPPLRARNSTWDILAHLMNAQATLSYPILSYPILSCPVLSCPVLSCPVLSCPVLSYPILSYPILS